MFFVFGLILTIYWNLFDSFECTGTHSFIDKLILGEASLEFCIWFCHSFAKESNQFDIKLPREWLLLLYILQIQMLVIAFKQHAKVNNQRQSKPEGTTWSCGRIEKKEREEVKTGNSAWNVYGMRFLR